MGQGGSGFGLSFGQRIGGGIMPPSSLLPGFSTGSLAMPPILSQQDRSQDTSQAKADSDSETPEHKAAADDGQAAADAVGDATRTAAAAETATAREAAAEEPRRDETSTAGAAAVETPIAEAARAAAVAAAVAAEAVTEDSAPAAKVVSDVEVTVIAEAPSMETASAPAAETQIAGAMPPRPPVTAPEAETIQPTESLPRDEPSFFEVQWLSASQNTESFIEEGKRLLVLAEGDPELLQELSQELGGDHTCAQDVPEDPQEFSKFSKVIFVASARVSAVDVLAGALRVLKRVIRMQMRLQRMRRPIPEIWFILQHTEAAQLVDLRGAEIPRHAGLWGVARCLRLERPGLTVGCLDIGAREKGAAALIRVLRSVRTRQDDTVEIELVAREQGDEAVELHTARLVEAAPHAAPSLPESFFAGERSYVLTGGTGALGVLSARWMVDHGASHLALMSSSGRPPQDAHLVFEQLTALSGVHVSVCQCDVEDGARVTSCLQELRGSMPPVRGVLHAAGRLNDHMFEYLETEHLAPVLGPKVEGALNLHAASADLELDFFIMFSSVAAMVGSVGQANYAAASAFLDAFAKHRRAQGLAGTSVQWGPWASMGLAARSGIPQNRFLRTDPVSCLDALGAVLGGGACPASGILGVARISWPGFFGRMKEVPSHLKNFEKFKDEDRDKKEAQARTTGAGRAGRAQMPPLLSSFGRAGAGRGLGTLSMSPLMGLRPGGLVPRVSPQRPPAAAAGAREEDSTDSSDSKEG